MLDQETLDHLWTFRDPAAEMADHLGEEFLPPRPMVIGPRAG
jgi:hypothetical protein